MNRRKNKKRSFLLPILFFELILVCVLSATGYSSEVIADITDSISNSVSEITENILSSGSAISDNLDSSFNSEEELIEEEEKKEEMRAVWISYIEFSNKLSELGKQSFTEKEFQDVIDDMFDHCVSWNMNTVIVHVRPYGDALYHSDYFPWSEYISGKQGKDPEFDPLKYMVTAAHNRGLKLEAWINPYRVATSTTKASSLSIDNQARKWMNSSKASKRRNVLSFGGNLYYNPAKKQVRNLIINGVKEIVENYDVDGIHFDDYFYPSLGDMAKPSAKVSKSKYKNYFDYKEYVTYKQQCEDNGETALSLVKWRRNNVSTLVQDVYSTIKKVNAKVSFGISPAGNIDNLLSKEAYFVDIKTWLSQSGYIDYICPQVYWSFDSGEYSFDTVIEKWLSYYHNSDIKFYVGIAVYKAAAGKNSIWDWEQWNGKTTILKKQIKYCRNIKEIDGFSFFSYQNFLQTSKKKEVKNLLSVLSE